MLMQERSRVSKACNRGASRLGEARSGEATPWTQNILAQGQSEASIACRKELRSRIKTTRQPQNKTKRMELIDSLYASSTSTQSHPANSQFRHSHGVQGQSQRGGQIQVERAPTVGILNGFLQSRYRGRLFPFACDTNLKVAQIPIADSNMFLQCQNQIVQRVGAIIVRRITIPLAFATCCNCVFESTGEDHFLESKKPMCLRSRK